VGAWSGHAHTERQEEGHCWSRPVYVPVHACVRVCVCVCVAERWRGGGRERGNKKDTACPTPCMCVCVCVTERERQRDRKKVYCCSHPWNFFQTVRRTLSCTHTHARTHMHAQREEREGGREYSCYFNVHMTHHGSSYGST